VGNNLVERLCGVGSSFDLPREFIYFLFHIVGVYIFDYITQFLCDWIIHSPEMDDSDSSSEEEEDVPPPTTTTVVQRGQGGGKQLRIPAPT
jgi:hypothetical protein